MKIELTHGCNCQAFEADGMPINQMPIKDIKDIVMKQMEVALQSEQYYDLYNLAYFLTEHFYDDWNQTDEPCECCGDYVETYTMEI